MKIIYLHQYFNTPDMAGGTRSFEMARRMVKYGHSVEMITTYRDETESEDWFETQEEGINVHWLPVPYSNRMSFYQRIQAFLKFAHLARKKAVSLEGDILFATSTPLTIAIPGVFASRKLRIPMVFEVRDLWPELPIAIGAIRSKAVIFMVRYLEKWAYRNSEHIIALSPGMKEGVAKTGYPSDQITVIPNSCDNDLFYSDNGHVSNHHDISYNGLFEHKIVIYTGTFGRINGAGYLVDIAEKMKVLNPEIRFLMVGDGIDYEKIVEKAQAGGLMDRQVVISKKIPKVKLISLLQKATVATSLFINLKEMQANSANKFFDALAAGKPVMINYEGWQADLLRETGAGIVVPPEDPGKAASMLNEFLMNEEKLKKASDAARKLALEEFDRDKLANELLNVLEKTAEEHEKSI